MASEREEEEEAEEELAEHQSPHNQIKSLWCCKGKTRQNEEEEVISWSLSEADLNVTLGSVQFQLKAKNSVQMERLLLLILLLHLRQ